MTGLKAVQSQSQRISENSGPVTVAVLPKTGKKTGRDWT